MSVAPTVARARRRHEMSETGGQGEARSALRVDDIERALVLAREVATATASGGAANLRVDHLRALFANGNGGPAPERIQAALEAAGLSVDPPVPDAWDTVSLRVDKRRATLATGGAGQGKRAAAGQKAAQPAVSLDDAEEKAAAEQAELRTPQSLAALMPALILPVLAASFLGPIFGATFAGLALLTSAMLSRPGALADGKLGPLRMPASLARSFLLVSSGIAIGALAMSVALLAAGGGESKRSDPNAPIGQPQHKRQTAPPASGRAPAAAPASTQRDRSAAARKAAAERKARADRRAKRREQARRRRERAQRQLQQAPPPSGGGATPAP